jgi:2-dehydro-3-deoxyphosphooctonate aldolase (KDO 8-P synthase)
VGWTHLKPIYVGAIEIGTGGFTVIAGPCLAESLDLCLQVGETAKSICNQLGFQYIFKASFDKANRSSGDSPRGNGLHEGLQVLAEVKRQLEVPVTTDIHLPEHAAIVSSVVDLLQIPAFLCRQTDLLAAAAETGKPVNVKKGQFLAPWDCKNIVAKFATATSGVMLTERGTSFGYNTLIVDMPGLETMRSLGVPVCFDATHSAQRPGGAGTTTGGVRETIPAMTRAAVAVGIDALFIEAHPDPSRAMSDAATQWPIAELDTLLLQAKKLRDALQN